MKYYYLISLLPTLDLEDDSYSLEQLDELLDQISSNLADEDREFLNYLLHENDNQNLLYILFKEYKDFEIRTFNQPLSIPMEVLQNYRRSYASLPSYLIDYLNDFAGTFSSMSMTEMEQNLNRYFYDSLLQQNCLFLHTYYAWLFQLKQTISELNQKTFPFLPTATETAEPFFPKVRTLNSLKNREEVVNQLMPSILSGDLEGIERSINERYRDFANEWQEPFSADQVFAYVVLLVRQYRWNVLTSQKNKDQTGFDQLIESIKDKKPSPKMPVI